MSSKDILKAYLLDCVERGDWHGASDAANDLRVLEARSESASTEVFHYFVPPGYQRVAFGVWVPVSIPQEVYKQLQAEGWKTL